MNRHCVAVPSVGSSATYSQAGRFRIDSACAILTASGAADVFALVVLDGTGSTIGAWLMQLAGVAGSRQVVTLAPGAQFLSAGFGPASMDGIATSAIPWELWIENGWSISLFCATLGAAPPTVLEPFQLVITLP